MTHWWPALLLAAAPATLYLLGVSRRGRAWNRWRTGSFVTGAALLGAALAPPLHGSAHTDLRAHLAQHLLLGMFAPVALVLGAPVTVLLGAVPVPARRRVAAVLRSRALHVLGHPATAAALSVGGAFALYLTPLFALSGRYPTVHQLVHLHVLLAGCLFAWAIAGPDPAPRRPSVLARAVVLVLAAAAHAYLAKLIYAGAGGLPPGGPHDPGEARQAAQWMYYGGDIAEIALAVALFGHWSRRPIKRPGQPGIFALRRKRLVGS